jgi:hypothetical protein
MRSKQRARLQQQWHRHVLKTDFLVLLAVYKDCAALAGNQLYNGYLTAVWREILHSTDE